MSKKSCYDCQKYPVCYARIEVEKVTNRPMFKLEILVKLLNTLATYCSEFKEEVA